jgi:tetratricopeptide (TPR) repeat protein
MKKVEAGDVAGAIKILEPQAKTPGAPPEVLSLLGALYVDAGRPADGLRLLKPLADREDAEPAVLYNAGRAALALKQVDAGRKYLERSLAKEPASPAARELGLLLSRQGHVVEGYRWLRPWALRSPRDLEARLTAASLALRLERPGEAEEMLAGLPETPEISPAVRLLRGEALAQKGDGRGALAALEPLRTQHPPGMDLEVRRALAEAYLAASQPAAAVELLKGRAAGNPTLALLLGRAQRQAGDLQGAAATLQPFVAKLPDSPAGLGDPRPPAGIALEYGLLLQARGDTAGGIAMLERSTRLLPTSVMAWQSLAGALTAAGRTAEAGQAQSKAQELIAARQTVEQKLAAAAAAESAAPAGAPSVPAMSGPAAQAMQLLQSGKVDEALAAARKGSQAEPKNVELRAVEVRALLLMKRWQDALTAGEAAVKAAPQESGAFYLRGAAKMALHDPGAEQDFRQALKLAPQNVAAMNDLGVLLSLQGKNAEARQLFQKALALQPDNLLAARGLKQLDAAPAKPAKPPGR